MATQDPYGAFSTRVAEPKPTPEQTSKDRKDNAVIAGTNARTELIREQLRDKRDKKAAADKIAADAAAEAPRAAAETKARMQGYLQDIQRAIDLTNDPAAMGLPGQALGNLWSTTAGDLAAKLEAIKSPIVLKAMQEARKGSAAGATGFGALAVKEMNLLAAKLGSLSQTQSREQLRATLQRIDGNFRRAMAYSAGYDPATPEGALLAGLPGPKTTTPPEGRVRAGKASSNKELAGLNDAVSSMIAGGRSPDQIRQWLREYKPELELDKKVQNLEQNIEYYKKTKKLPPVNLESASFAPSEGLIASTMEGPVGAAALAAVDQASMGTLDELSGNREQTAMMMRGMRAQNPGASAIGDVVGAVGSGVGAEMMAAKYGLKLPMLLQGLPQNMIYGAGSAEPGQRLSGMLEQGVMTPIENLGGDLVGSTVGKVLRGASDDARTLSQGYGLPLTPGQMDPGSAARENLLANLPVIGPQVQQRRNESLLGFNKSVFDEALAPIGVKAPAIGQDGIAKAQQAVGGAYDAALGGVSVVLDQPFVQGVRGAAYSDLGKLRDIGPELTAEVDNIFARYADPSGTMSGEGLQNALQELQKLKSSYKQDPRWATSIAPNLDEISDAYSGMLERQFPENFEMFTNANTAYRNLSILEKAVDFAPGGDVFGPGNLRAATRQGTQKFGGKKASARGDRPFNEQVMAALGVIPNQAGDVSLASRITTPLVGAGGLGVAYSALPSGDDANKDDGVAGALPASVAGMGLLTGLATLPYSKFGTRARTATMAGDRTPAMRTLGDLIQNYTPAVTRGVVRGATARPGVPMPLNFDYSQAGGPQFDALIDRAMPEAAPAPEAPAQPAPEESVLEIDGRPVALGPDGRLMFLDDGTSAEQAVAMARGGHATRGLAYGIRR